MKWATEWIHKGVCRNFSGKRKGPEVGRYLEYMRNTKVVLFIQNRVSKEANSTRGQEVMGFWRGGVVAVGSCTVRT